MRPVCFLLGLLLTGCASTDYVRIEPVRYEAAPPSPTPNRVFEWTPTSTERARMFRVRIGSDAADKLVATHKVAKNEYWTFLRTYSIGEVVANKHCSAGAIPNGPLGQAMGQQVPPEVWIYVQCVE